MGRRGDHSISEYNRKRDFEASPEPVGKRNRAAQQPSFVIQKHDASRLHYDLRLEVDGVLASWAVPKGPTLVTGVRRLVVHVEDHPLDYAGFEGNIREGNYGAGSVIVWDRGTYRNLRGEKTGDGKRSMADSLADGKVEVWLEGEKLRGGFVLIRTGEHNSKNWLLMKMSDDEARDEGEITEDRPESVLSGKTVEEVAESGESGDGVGKSAAGAGA